MEGRSKRQKMRERHAQLSVKPCSLTLNQLPTGADVVGRIMMLRLEEMEMRCVDERHVSITTCINKVADEVISIWGGNSQTVVRIFARAWH